MHRYLDALRRGWRRPEVRRHPIQAVSRRLRWAWHWRHSPNTPILLDPWRDGLKISLPHTTNASLLFYRTHSDPLLVSLLEKLLSPGMTFLDIGAHIGEFSLVGAALVGPQGRVFALEPLPPCAQAIRDNAELNQLKQICVLEAALSDHSGTIGFTSDPALTGGWIAASTDKATFQATTWTLDGLLENQQVPKADVMKLDASGNELAVVRGASNTFAARRVRTIVMKLYNPTVVRERFGYDAHDTIAALGHAGFQMAVETRAGSFAVGRPEDIDRHFDRLVYCHLLVAKPTR